MCKNLPITSLKDLLLSNKDSIDIRDCYVRTGIEGILESLDQELVGLKDVKTRVREISSVLLFDRIRELQELGSLNSSLHMSFTGRAGTGKTTCLIEFSKKNRNKKILYLCFNNRAVRDAKERYHEAGIQNTTTSTIHGLAKQTKRDYEKKGKFQKKIPRQ